MIYSLPGLKKYGIEEKDIDYICAKTEIKNNPGKVKLWKIYQEILSARCLLIFYIILYSGILIYLINP